MTTIEDFATEYAENNNACQYDEIYAAVIAGAKAQREVDVELLRECWEQATMTERLLRDTTFEQWLEQQKPNL